MKTATLASWNTKSGLPGNAFTWPSHFNPRSSSSLAISRSGPVSRPLMRDMVRERCSTVMTSRRRMAGLLDVGFMVTLLGISTWRVDLVAGSSRILPPSASALIGSLRGVGYSLEAAVADIIDNSLAANANRVEATFDWNDGSPWISILDNGDGMSSDQLVEGLRFGGTGPEIKRSERDLGRFGLGLKTASLSQCRRLTVATTASGNTSCFRWDLDHIRETSDAWELLEGAANGSESLIAPVAQRESGTLILWELVDFGKKDDRPNRSAFYEDIERVERHLSMVFHRYISGDARTVRIEINGRKVKAWDPFLEAHGATIRRPEQQLDGPGGRVSVRGFVLPHRDRFGTEEDYDNAGGPSGWNAQQGFYIYRNKRLLTAGGWLGLGGTRGWTREEASRLGRIRIDIPNTADRDWSINILKSTARPPSEVRARLAAIAQDIRKTAREVFVHRGNYGPRPQKSEVERVWEPAARTAEARYRIKRDHPAVVSARPQHAGLAEAFDAMLVLIERTVPIDRIWLDVAERPSNLDRKEISDDDALFPAAASIASALMRTGVSRAAAIDKVSHLDPYDSIPNFSSRLSALLPT